MAGFNIDEERKIIPRWRTFDETLKLRELNSIKPPQARQQVTNDFLMPRIMDWLEHKTIGHAADLVGVALTLGQKEKAIEAAKFLLQDSLNVSPWARELAEQVLKTSNSIETLVNTNEPDESFLYKRVKIFRDLLRTEPRDPITWVELSHTYTILGLGEHAERSMIVALQLAANNRFVLRSASRLWVHLGDLERAHDIIVRSERTRYDPWLLAAEIAIGSIAERKPKFVKSARQMLSAGQLSSVHISELASAIATLELDSGSIKKAKKLFSQSLEDPTENSIAQAVWVSRRYRTIRFEDKHMKLPNAFEAEVWIYYQKSQWEEAVNQCKLWQSDQPFSSNPSARGSYIAGIGLEDYATSERFAERGLKANPTNFLLLNNLAFARINRGNIKGAKETLSKINRSQLSERDRVILQATQGFLEFRTGEVAVGRKLYSEARSKARKMQDRDGSKLFALASAFHAIEEASQKVLDESSVLYEAFQALRRDPDPIFRVLERKLTEAISRHKSKNIK